MKELNTKLKNYKKELGAIKSELQSLPHGRLVRRGTVYTHLTDDKEVGITHNEDLIRRLYRKKYLLSREKQLDRNISIISKSKAKIDHSTADELIDSFSTTYKALPKDYFHHPSIKDWSIQEYRKNTYKQEACIYESENGVLVRSKSEQTIANLLEKHEILYRYDALINLGNKSMSPDFIIKNPFTGKIIIWEHFGAFHKQDYEAAMNEKMDHYRKHGYIPFETIIYTFEFNLRDKQFLQNLIEDIIKSH